MSRVLLSLAVIMRDSAGEILACLESAAEAADEMVIVDTGSKDASVKIVRKFLRKWQEGAPGRRGKLHYFQWQDDFALAKNYALARCHGEYVLFLDSDESLSAGTRGNLRPLLVQLARGEWPAGLKMVQVPGEPQAEAGDFDVLELWRENVDLEGHPVAAAPEDLAVRLLRRQELLRYRGEVHEQLVLADGRPAKVAVADRELLTIRHTGYRPGVREAKHKRNQAILLREEQQGGSTFLLDYYLAEAHLARKEWAAAIECAKRCQETTLPLHDRIAPCRIIYQALREMEKEACRRAGLQVAEGELLPEPQEGESRSLQAARIIRRQGEQLLAQGLAAFPDYPDFYYFRGGRRWNGGDKEGGRKDLLQALALAETFPQNHPEADFRFKPLIPELLAALVQVCREMGDEQEAVFFQKKLADQALAPQA
ncbi:MAG: glycosyltransferase [Selenomonas sp.]|nr:glycosyltransferase [Selenomonas sp.]